MRSKADLAMLFSLWLATLASEARASITWRGDFEVGNLSQWSDKIFPAQIRLVTTPARGAHAARIELHNEDRWPNGLRRVELGYIPASKTFEGSEHYYGWSMFPSTDMPLAGSHADTIGYWESSGLYMQVMVFNVSGAKVSFAALLNKPDGKAAGTLWRTGDFAPGRWHDFVLHVKWSTDPLIGFVELWYDGGKVVGRTSVQTMHRVNNVTYTSFLHLGLLHGNFDAPSEALFLDSAVDATNPGDVMVAPDRDAGAGRDAGDPLDGRDGGRRPLDAGSGPVDADALENDGSMDIPLQDGPPAGANNDAEEEIDAEGFLDGPPPVGCFCSMQYHRRRPGGLAFFAQLAIAVLAIRIGRRHSGVLRR